MKVVFRVDASIHIGTGHVMRCLTLAQALRGSHIHSEFICYKHNGNLIDKIRLNGFNVHELSGSMERYDDKSHYSYWLGATQQKDAEDCIRILKKIKVDWLVVDHYGIDESWQQELKPYHKKLMVVDDLANRKHQCDILLDQTFGRKQKDYERFVPKSCKLLLGSRYALLRAEFSKWREYSIKRRNDPYFKKLLINMGGVDINNFTEKILKELENCTFLSDVDIIVIMGQLAPNLESVKKTAEALRYKVEVKVDADNMAEIMANSDLAIGASGSTTWERCCLGLPTIQLVIARNQYMIAKILAEKNIIKTIKNIKKLPNTMSNAIIHMEELSNASREVSDGMGSKRVLHSMLEH
jgi:UDP-2,4-diacetamido-2,4,6-trideoxy-beta-L-altropyranose hydrolase